MINPIGGLFFVHKYGDNITIMLILGIDCVAIQIACMQIPACKSYAVS